MRGSHGSGLDTELDHSIDDKQGIFHCSDVISTAWGNAAVEDYSVVGCPEAQTTKYKEVRT